MKRKKLGTIWSKLLIISLFMLASCSTKFDSFDPTTSTLRWVIMKDKK